MGTISANKKSISITLERELIERIKQDANLEMRNLSSQIAYILTKYYQDKDFNEINF